MIIQKSSLFRKRKCAYGDFSIIPEKGWELLQMFIDHESKLLVITLSLTDRNKWIKNGYDGYTIPTKDFKVDLQRLTILTTDEWRQYFDYSPKETISEDKKYKLISCRQYEPEKDTDFYFEELYDIPANTLINSTKAIAFQEKKRINLLEQLYTSIREREEQARIAAARLTLEAFYQKQLLALQIDDIIFQFSDQKDCYQLVYSGKQFVLSSTGKPSPPSQCPVLEEWQIRSVFEHIGQFWNWFVSHPKWYEQYESIPDRASPTRVLLLAKNMIDTCNELRKDSSLPYAAHHLLNRWTGLVWSEEYKPEVIKQWCPHCGNEVPFQSRYPKCICHTCYNKEKLDENGNLLEFYNLGFSGGLKIVIKNRNGTIIKEDNTRYSCDCFIDNKSYVAEEARFGGIVIQAKE